MNMNSSPVILSRFHTLIRSVAGKFVDKTGIELPKLPDVFGEKRYFPVPGMYGGFHYLLEPLGDDQRLIVTSSIRIVEDSEQTFEITANQIFKR